METHTLSLIKRHANAMWGSGALGRMPSDAADLSAFRGTKAPERFRLRPKPCYAIFQIKHALLSRKWTKLVRTFYPNVTCYVRVFAIVSPSVVCRLSSATFVRPTHGLKLTAIFLCHFVLYPCFDLIAKFYGDRLMRTPSLGALKARG